LNNNFSKHFDKSGLIRSQHTGEIVEWIDMFLDQEEEGILLIITPPRYGKTEICNQLMSFLKEDFRYAAYNGGTFNPFPKVSIYDDMIKNRIESQSAYKNLKIAETIKTDTAPKKIIICSLWNSYGYADIIRCFLYNVITIKFPSSRYKFEERYNQEWHDGMRKKLGLRIFKNLMECGN